MHFYSDSGRERLISQWLESDQFKILEQRENKSTYLVIRNGQEIEVTVKNLKRKEVKGENQPLLTTADKVELTAAEKAVIREELSHALTHGFTGEKKVGTFAAIKIKWKETGIFDRISRAVKQLIRSVRESNAQYREKVFQSLDHLADIYTLEAHHYTSTEAKSKIAAILSDIVELKNDPDISKSALKTRIETLSNAINQQLFSERESTRFLHVRLQFAYAHVHEQSLALSAQIRKLPEGETRALQREHRRINEECQRLRVELDRADSVIQGSKDALHKQMNDFLGSLIDNETRKVHDALGEAQMRLSADKNLSGREKHKIASRLQQLEQLLLKTETAQQRIATTSSFNDSKENTALLRTLDNNLLLIRDYEQFLDNTGNFDFRKMLMLK